MPIPTPDQIQAALAALGAFLVVAGPAVKGLLAASRGLETLAIKTSWKGDDVVFTRTSAFLLWLSSTVDTVARVIPHMQVKGQTETVTRAQAATLPPAKP
jgi:hypothetical protein